MKSSSCRHARVVGSTLLALLPATAAADEPADAIPPTISGGWQSFRDALAARGVQPEVSYTVDVMANPSAGGLRRGARALANLHLILEIDAEPLVGLRGTTAKLYVHDNHGGAPDADLLASAQGLDNIEIGEDGTLLYEAWLQQSFAGDRVSVLAGLYDLNSEFYANDPAALFIHPSYGIGPDLAQSGPSGPSIFPVTSLGARVRVAPHPTVYVQAAAIDATRPVGLEDGALLIAEAGFTPADTKLAAGAWRYTEAVEGLDGAMPAASQGAYALADRRVYAEGDDDQGASVFARVGLAAARAHQLDASWSVGVVYTGLVPTRDEGQLGLAVTSAHNGAPFRAAAMDAGAPVDAAETEVELTYQDAITSWLSLQLDGQYVHNPGTDPTVDDAILVGSRVSCTF